ncbi:MAG: alpha-hydroxy-acid oxidizing protein [Ruminococcaceae bacterium]|nr:alpha-hydroxy-acid oxidizing protein [Oscillospiraceae bacterium]
MNYSDVLINAKKNIGPNCKVCPDCNGIACGNTLPGPGSKAPGNGARTNREGWKNIRVNMDVIAPEAEILSSFEFLGKHFDFPVFTAPVGALSGQYNQGDSIFDFNEAMIGAAKEFGCAAFFGDGMESGVLEAALKCGIAAGNVAVPVLNPVAKKLMLKNIDIINSYMPFAMTLVIDSAGLPHFKKNRPDCQTRTVSELSELISAAKMPVILKGIMTAKAAEKAVLAGASGIIVSNHGGRALSDGASTAEVLPEIADAVGGKIKIIVDGGIRTGVDVFKALALGADAAMICRPVIIAHYGGAKEGICAYFDKLRTELLDTMYLCGARKLSEITREMIRF